MAGKAQERLDEIASEFTDLNPRERLELLLEFAEGLPDVPEALHAERDAGDHRVHECMTPVYLWVLPQNGHVRVHAEVAPEAPTVKGFVAILVDAFSGASPDEVLTISPDILRRLGLLEALGMVRMRGLSAIFNRIRQAVVKLAAEEADKTS